LTTAPRRTPPKGRPGSRSRRVPPPRGSFYERNRRRLLYAGLVAIIAVGAAFAYASFTTKGYVCLSQWEPGPTPTTAPSATPHIGYFQDDLGRTHVPAGTRVRYAFCPPASGLHYIGAGIGPIDARFYGSSEVTIPEGWIHNMEHGGLVVLYRCGSGDTCDQAQQDALKSFFSTFPNSPLCGFTKGQIGPVITRFDEMKFPYAALVWDEVLPLDKFDPDLIKAFFAQQGERTNPEVQCARPTPTPGPTSTPGPTDTPAATSPTTEPSAAPSPGPSST
jgi:Protein of unknown function (DUF3105)